MSVYPAEVKTPSFVAPPEARSESFSSHQILPVIVVFLALAYTAVTARIWTRHRILRHLGWDDAAIVVSLVRSQDMLRFSEFALIAGPVELGSLHSLQLIAARRLCLNCRCSVSCTCPKSESSSQSTPFHRALLHLNHDRP